MQYDAPADDHERLVTFDIETTHYKPEQGETVAIGVGEHAPGAPGVAATYDVLARDDVASEGELIRRGIERVDAAAADALVSYNGIAFDVEFLAERAERLGVAMEPPALHTAGSHVDLFADRVAVIESRYDSPSLEACLDSYDYPVPSTIWNGEPVTNERFGEELGPALLAATREGDADRLDALRDVLAHYLITDLEANFAIYYADRGVSFAPAYLGHEGVYDA